MAAKVAENDSRRLSLPQNPDAYKLELPSDFKVPEGMEFKFDDQNPTLSEARKAAHEMGLDQAQFSRLLGLYAGNQVQSTQAIVAARNAEVAKLGAAGPARVDAINTWLDAKGYSDLKPVLFTAKAVEAVEKMMRAASSQGAGTFQQNGREADAGGRVSEEEYQKMSPAARLDYTRKFDQSQFQNGTGR